MTIDALLQGFSDGTIDKDKYYEELFVEANKQQERLNAFVRLTKDKANNSVTQGPLQGIPGVFKDNFSTKGIATTASSKMLEDYIPVYDATVVKKLYEAGVCLVGKASMDELAMGGTNMSAYTGPVYNPWDTSRIPGGSSGGSAAVVASGLVPFALGTDTGDSIRKPAGYCGVVGFKPTWGRISRYGVIPYASSLDHVGVFSRNVMDAARVTEVIAGHDPHDMTSSTKSVPPYSERLACDMHDLKIAVLTSVSDEIENVDIKNNFTNVIEIAKKLGATVENVTLPKELLKAVLPTYTIIANSEATSNHACLDGIKYGNRQPGSSTEEIMINSRTDGFGDHIKRRFVLGNLALATQNQERMFRKAQRVRRLLVEQIQDIFASYDIILTPNSGHIAPLLENLKENRLSDSYLILENHLILSNFAGTPSITIPSGFVDNMPIGINIMGRLFEEETVLQTAYALEQELGYANQYCKGEK